MGFSLFNAMPQLEWSPKYSTSVSSMLKSLELSFQECYKLWSTDEKAKLNLRALKIIFQNVWTNLFSKLTLRVLCVNYSYSSVYIASVMHMIICGKYFWHWCHQIFVIFFSSIWDLFVVCCSCCWWLDSHHLFASDFVKFYCLFLRREQKRGNRLYCIAWHRWQ